MPLYVIGDLHLGLSVDKPMDIFGADWDNHTGKIKENFKFLQPSDTLILLGDTSWGLKPEEAAADFRFIGGFNGRKLIVKGNHDYWWATVGKMRRFLDGLGLPAMDFVHNTAFRVGDIAVCGTRGWFYEEERSEQNEKVFRRELGRLKASLDRGKTLGAELVAFLHYPPLYEGYRCDEIVDMLNEYGVKRCYYGHLHGAARGRAIEGEYFGIDYKLVSADHVNFTPVEVG
ncbi:ser/threonine protein phosphatase [Clostridia bacterium]|nr:ser/threonine protein phosphatase [Clostridia bacterium]